MKDDELLAAVRDCLTTARDRVAGEQLERPVLAIMRRARRRRLRQSLSTTVTAAIVAVAAFALLLPGSGDNGTTSARLAAWTVVGEPGGKIGVTIRELNNPPACSAGCGPMASRSLFGTCRISAANVTPIAVFTCASTVRAVTGSTTR